MAALELKRKRTLASVRKWRQNNPAAALVNNARRRSKKSGIEFSISTQDVLDLWPQDGRCPVFGFPLVWGENAWMPGGDCGLSPATATLDRIDNTKGYAPGNIAVISWRANKLKGNSTPEELARLLAWLAETTG